jgi:transposase-like protein
MKKFCSKCEGVIIKWPCPKCGSNNVEVRNRQYTVKLLRDGTITTFYKCNDCDNEYNDFDMVDAMRTARKEARKARQ